MTTLWIFSPEGKRQFTLSGDPVTIGRIDANTIQVDEPIVSKNHARIDRDERGWVVEDLVSANGTWLDGKRIDHARLVAGARLRIGSTEFVLDDTVVRDDRAEKFDQNATIFTSMPAIPAELFDEQGNLKSMFLDDVDEAITIAPRPVGSESIEEQKLRLIRLVGEVAIDLVESTSVAAAALRILVKEVEADRGFVCLFGDDGSHVPLASYGVKPDEPVRFSRTVLETMQRERAGILFRPNKSADGQLDSSLSIESLKEMNVHSTLCVPLWARANIIGFLSLDMIDTKRPFSRRHLDLLIAVTHQVALGLERARLSETADRERRRRDYLGKYLDHKLLRTLGQADDGPDPLAPREQIVTVLFCDIVAFGKISEGCSPTDLAAFVRDYLTTMTEILFANEGTVDKYIGDAVMALFGAPVPSEQAAANAIRAALAMRENAGSINGETIRLRFGIATGSAVVGNIGSAQRMEYTALGDTVNVAARLEAFARPDEIVIDGTTKAAVGSEFAVESIGAIDVKNRVQRVDVFRVLHEM